MLPHEAEDLLKKPFQIIGYSLLKLASASYLSALTIYEQRVADIHRAIGRQSDSTLRLPISR
jgi:hypothetical protein